MADDSALAHAQSARDELAAHDAEIQQLLSEIDMALSTGNLQAAAGAMRQLKRHHIQSAELIGRYLGSSLARSG